MVEVPCGVPCGLFDIHFMARQGEGYHLGFPVTRLLLLLIIIIPDQARPRPLPALPALSHYAAPSAQASHHPRGQSSNITATRATNNRTMKIPSPLQHRWVHGFHGPKQTWSLAFSQMNHPRVFKYMSGRPPNLPRCEKVVHSVFALHGRGSQGTWGLCHHASSPSSRSRSVR